MLIIGCKSSFVFFLLVVFLLVVGFGWCWRRDADALPPQVLRLGQETAVITRVCPSHRPAKAHSHVAHDIGGDWLSSHLTI